MKNRGLTLKKLILIIAFSIGAFGNTAAEIYKNRGIEAVERYLQNQLQTREYWQEKIKDNNVSLGYYESAQTLLVTNKVKKDLKVFQVTEKGPKFVKDYDVIVGAYGDKQEEGDLKTPLGVYTITKRFQPTDPFYGPKAFALSYPNIYDKAQDKNGYGIWIHGSPLDGSKRGPMSKGCIVLDNETLLDLEKQIPSNEVITIVNENGMEAVKKSEITTILAELYRWQNAWRENKIIEYLSFYHDDFIRYDGMEKKTFENMKKSIFARGEEKKIIFKQIDISPYPDEEGKRLFKIAFFEEYVSKTHTFRGNKKLYVELSNESFKILTER